TRRHRGTGRTGPELPGTRHRNGPAVCRRGTDGRRTRTVETGKAAEAALILRRWDQRRSHPALSTVDAFTMFGFGVYRSRSADPRFPGRIMQKSNVASLNDERLLELAVAIADGTPVDWSDSAVSSDGLSDSDRSIVQRLQYLQHVVDGH